MTPKEKAISIIDKMYQSATWEKEEDYNPLQQYQRVKKCALIAVDEIIKIITNLWGGIKEMDYWHQVKNEIEKI